MAVSKHIRVFLGPGNSQTARLQDLALELLARRTWPRKGLRRSGPPRRTSASEALAQWLELHHLHREAAIPVVPCPVTKTMQLST